MGRASALVCVCGMASAGVCDDLSILLAMAMHRRCRPVSLPPPSLLSDPPFPGASLTVVAGAAGLLGKVPPHGDGGGIALIRSRLEIDLEISP